MNDEIPYRPPGWSEYVREGARKNSAILRKMQGQPEPSATAEAKPDCAPLGLLDDALRITINIAEEYSRLCCVMHSMPYRHSEYKAGERFMDALENLRDELLKRKSSNAPDQRPGELPKTL